MQKSVVKGKLPYIASGQGFMNYEREKWLNSLGLRFDPFRYLEASEDPHLFDYVVIRDEILRKVWVENHSLVFAPPGGGKTALRLYFTRACWLPPARGFPFPLSYDIPRFLPWHNTPSLESHLQAILRAAAATILTMLALRPFLWEELPSEERVSIASFLHSALPLPLGFYAEQMKAAKSPEPLFNSFGRALAFSGVHPHFEKLLDLLNLIEPKTLPNLGKQWEIFLELVEAMGFAGVYLLVDGLDFAYETQVSGENALSLIKPLLEAMLELESRRVFLKAFLPEEHIAMIGSSFSYLSVTIEWDKPFLKELIRRRLQVASDGSIASLDALCSPPLRDLDELILESSPSLLPRAVIQTVSELFNSHLSRAGPEGLLEVEDIEVLKKRLGRANYVPRI